ncbi:hypothetical protein [Rhodococcus tibetensis]|uniref:Uncharacterized protein n=1 Tax=Rhodococcus tibetensis TaxID=2965064 RepID=A0ABT1QEY4_9NOCA|nr:hypothetical protein [Rhodococcus sp. FXJ9.536]MCQ4119697.1 hypothetical protein [Rhodococcus sp. FXJ9.536]
MSSKDKYLNKGQPGGIGCGHGADGRVRGQRACLVRFGVGRYSVGVTHNLGGLNADIHHADRDTPPANLPREA